MAAQTETAVVEIPLSNGYLLGIYTGTAASGGDTFTLDKYELVRWTNAFTTADGTAQEAYCAGTDNIVTVDVAGAATFVALGTSKKSTGGAT